MIEPFLIQPGYTEMAKAVNSTSAAITTIFLFSRIAARKTRFRGLWYDDYLLIAAWIVITAGNGLGAAAPAYGYNVLSGSSHGWKLMMSAMSTCYIAGAFAKSAFIVTLLRLSSRRTKHFLSFLLVVTWVFAIAVAVISWLRICSVEEVGFQSRCFNLSLLVWIHFGHAITTIVTDVTLAYVPWSILRGVSFQGHEKVGVGISMSLVGLAALLCITRCIISIYTHKWTPGLNPDAKDWTYGALTMFGLMQGETVIYIVAQAIPLIRVLVVGSVKDSDEAPNATGSVREIGKGKSPRTGLDSIAEAPIELVQLSSGKIVPADSEEARAEFGPSKASTSAQVAPLEDQTRPAARDVDDPVHKNFKDMGLSERAWSQSPSPTVLPTAGHQRHISDMEVSR